MAVALSDQDFDRIRDNVKVAFLDARGEGGYLPCADHETRMRKVEQLIWRWGGILLIAGTVSAFIGSALAGGAFDRAADKMLTTSPATGGP